jgi:hypothetical protein
MQASCSPRRSIPSLCYCKTLVILVPLACGRRDTIATRAVPLASHRAAWQWHCFFGANDGTLPSRRPVTSPDPTISPTKRMTAVRPQKSPKAPKKTAEKPPPENGEKATSPNEPHRLRRASAGGGKSLRESQDLH